MPGSTGYILAKGNLGGFDDDLNPTIVGAALRAAVFCHWAARTETLRVDLVSGDSVRHEVVPDRIGAPLRQLLVHAVAAARIGVPFHRDLVLCFIPERVRDL